MKSFLRKVGIVTVCLLTLIVLCVGFIAAQAYLETPKIIEQAEKSGKLTLKVEDVPKDFLDVLLKVEDPNFYNHNGVDLSTKGAGWTTITQSLVKTYFYKDFSPGFLRHRKINQTIIALVFNSQVDKQMQLRLFLNSTYFGNVSENKEIIGFQEASKEYFGKSFAELNKDEFLALTAMIIAPNDFSLRTKSEKNAERVERIKKLLNGECEPKNRDDVYYENCFQVKSDYGIQNFKLAQ